MVDFKTFKLNGCVFTTKLKNILVKANLWKQIQLEVIEKLSDWNAPSKKRRTELLWTMFLQFLPQEKEGQKKQSPKVLQFLIMVNRVLMCQTSMCALVLLFWIPYQSKRGPNCSEEGSYNFSHKKRRSKEANPKGPPVSYQENQGVNMPNKHVLFSVAFLNSFSK